MDRLTKEQRRKNMQAVKCKGTSIELLLGKALWSKGVRYRKNDKSVFGKPDFTIKKLKIAIFCDSEFWHGKNWEERKFDHKSNQEFWIPKIERNMERDKEVNAALETQGWTVIRFWGKQIKKELDHCVQIVLDQIKEKKGLAPTTVSIDENLGVRICLYEPENISEAGIDSNAVAAESLSVYKSKKPE